jgi:hypothetical protein
MFRQLLTGNLGEVVETSKVTTDIQQEGELNKSMVTHLYRQ